ncbi:unnamed protein product [Alopecurus aequalis]
MAWSSSAGSAPGFRRAAGRSGPDGHSPVRYREDAMAYEPAKYCNCDPRRKAPRWISWSRLNPGRRYYACVDALWHDAELPKFFSELIGDLRDAVWRLRGQGNMARVDNQNAFVASVEQRAAVMGQTEDQSAAMLLSVQDELRKKNAKIVAVKVKYETVMFLFIVFVLGLVEGKLLLQSCFQIDDVVASQWGSCVNCMEVVLNKLVLEL